MIFMAKLTLRTLKINFQNENILFRHMKTKRQINVVLSDTLKIVLQEYTQNLQLKDDDILFPKLNGEKLRYNPLDVISKKNRKVKLNKK